MKHISLYIDLMRLNRPAGIWLLLFPCWWAISLASAPDFPDIKLLILFAIGAIIMRSAGCIINDMIDREIDAQVERTKNRPLASGQLSMKSAFILLIILLICALLVLYFLPIMVTYTAMGFFIPVIIYPFMKRFISWPQLVLALTFNAGAIVGWVAVQPHDMPTIASCMLYISCIFWTLIYDTIYAHQDKDDDAKIGIKSSALTLGARTKKHLYIFAALMILTLAITCNMVFTSYSYISMLVIASIHLYWQIKTVDLDSRSDCMKKFKSNVITGWIIFLGILLSY